MLTGVRHLIFVFALLGAAVSDSWSQQLPSGGAAVAQPQPSANERGTTEAPFVVTRDKPFVLELRTTGATYEGVEKAETDRKLVEYARDLDILTAILAGIGALQFFVFGWQGWQLKRSVDFGERRDQILERADLWPGPGEFESKQHGRMRFNITVHNTGKTVGIITDVYYKLSTEAEYETGAFTLQHYHREDVIPPDMAAGVQKRTGASVELIGSEPKILHGYILYKDVFKNTRKCSWKHRVLRDGNSEPLPGCYSEWE
jgi:hypothetical protein